MKQTEEKNIYQLKISLKYTRPIIWRRIQLYGDVTLAKLHRILQSAMGWCDSHLHQFIVGRRLMESRAAMIFWMVSRTNER